MLLHYSPHIPGGSVRYELFEDAVEHGSRRGVLFYCSKAFLVWVCFYDPTTVGGLNQITSLFSFLSGSGVVRF